MPAKFGYVTWPVERLPEVLTEEISLLPSWIVFELVTIALAPIAVELLGSSVLHVPRRTSEKYPIAVLLSPDWLLPKAELPTAVFPSPETFPLRAAEPVAVLLLPVTFLLNAR